VVIKVPSVAFAFLSDAGASPVTFFLTDSRTARTKPARASAAAICSMNELPACDLSADPTAATVKPSARALQTQSGARFLVFGNKHLIAFFTLAFVAAFAKPSPQASTLGSIVMDNNTHSNMRITNFHRLP